MNVDGRYFLQTEGSRGRGRITVCDRKYEQIIDVLRMFYRDSH